MLEARMMILRLMLILSLVTKGQAADSQSNVVTQGGC